MLVNMAFVFARSNGHKSVAKASAVAQSFGHNSKPQKLDSGINPVFGNLLVWTYFGSCLWIKF